MLTMDGPVLVFGGPYGNLEATEALLGEAARLGIPPQRIVCTGDVVAYGADARATVALVRRAGIHVVMGNCEESLAAAAADCGCGYAAGSACAALAEAWYAHARATLGADELAWMAALPRRLDLVLGRARLAVVHGGVRQINRFVFASSPAAAKRQELSWSGADGVIGGHCGLPFSEILDGKLWHNAGTIGLPANDGTPRVWYSLLAPAADGIAIEHRALGYDHTRAAEKMRAAGLPEGYAACLASGVWPSEDVLPAAELARRGAALAAGGLVWRKGAADAIWPPWQPRAVPPLDPRKFADPARTAAGVPRAQVALGRLDMLWFNTGSLCNIACATCYIESSPSNRRLAYLSAAEARAYLDEIASAGLGTQSIGFTGGEPFLNRELPAMLEDCLARGLRALVLTNAMRPMQRMKRALLALKERHGRRLGLRVSLDHYCRELHEAERGAGTWQPALDGLSWLAANGFNLSVAGRLQSGESEIAMRQGYGLLFAERGLAIDALDPAQLVLFPEMDASLDVPEIAAAEAPPAPMCASQRMVVKRRGAAPSVVACTLIPYDEAFELGATLAAAARPVALNHPHCARFCVLGRGSCAA